MKLNITQDHIDKAIQERQESRESQDFKPYWQWEQCPIAQALQEETQTYVEVGNSYATTGSGANTAWYELPGKARRLIKNFDRERNVKPTTINLIESSEKKVTELEKEEREKE